jgi:PAS domain S-box-containing protein
MDDKEIRILHLEDVPSDAALTKREISKVLKYYTIHVVETESDFISELGLFKPHLIVSDYQLPSFNGLSALKIVLDKSPITPVIILTGAINEDTAVDCMKAGATDYIIKEHIKRFGAAIVNALEQKEIKLEKIRTNEALQKSEEKFRSLFKNHSAKKLLIDAGTGDIVDANNAAALYYGWAIEELKSMNINEISTLTLKDVKEELYKSRDLNRIHFDFIHRLKDGTLRNVEVFSSKVEIEGKEFFHSIIHDVTEKKKAEQQIILLSKAIEQSPVSIVITEPNGSIEYVNKNFSECTGYAIHEVIGQNPSILKSGYQSIEFYQKMWETITAGSDWKGEIQNKKKNGELYWESIAISSIVNEQGDIQHYIAVKEDITEMKHIYEELITAKVKAEESDQLKTAFLHNISHEVRTPMNAIIGFSEFLNDPELIPEKRKNFTDIIIKNCNQLLSIISDIISIATIEAGQEKIKEKEIELNAILLTLYQQFLLKVKKKNISLNLAPFLFKNGLHIITDETKLIQILTNLIDNALKFTNKGYINFGYTIKDKEIELFVEDTGIGIPTELHEEIFKRFRQVETTIARQYGGSGLGLSISKAYVELMNGKMWLNSELEKGTTFYFTIPYNINSKKSIPETLQVNGLKLKTEHSSSILIAEDEESNFMLLLEMLSGLNINILKASNGLEALEICKSKEPIDLVLMDIKMPVMDGYEATKQIKKLKPNLPIIAQTAFSTNDDKNKALLAGCIDFISKPFNQAILITKINEHLHKK